MLTANQTATITILFVLFASHAFGQSTLYHSDPAHIWNRLHDQLSTRAKPDGTVYDKEGLEPLLLPHSTFLTQGKSHEQAIRLLDEFLQSDSSDHVTDPLRRAILQRDLWAIFVTVSDSRLEKQPERRALQVRLARAMRRVALSKREIAGLPDNLAKAVEAKEHPTRFTKASVPFLPDDLLSPDSAWVRVRSRLRRDDIAAPLHVQATPGRSAFFLYFRLPGGRPATLKYLQTLEELTEWRELQQIPLGTQVALLRRMLTIDQAGELTLTPIAESLQLRAYHQLRSPTMVEFALNRESLFRDQIGLRLTTDDDVSLYDLSYTGFSPFHEPDPLAPNYKRLDKRKSANIMESCIVCHAGPGIYGFQSMMAGHFERPSLAISPKQDDQVQPIIDDVYKKYTWGLLQGLWEFEPPASAN